MYVVVYWYIYMYVTQQILKNVTDINSIVCISSSNLIITAYSGTWKYMHISVVVAHNIAADIFSKAF